jgi:hypothetical protein
MSHLRLVPSATAPVGAIPAPRRGVADAPAAATTAKTEAPPQPDRLVPARLLLALAGRCSCPACCAAYAAGRQEPHDPRIASEDRRPRAVCAACAVGG